MSKTTFKKQVKPDQKLTNFFPRRESGASSSQPPSSSPPKYSAQPEHGAGPSSLVNTSGQSSRPRTSLSKATVKGRPRADQEVISVSSGSSHKSHISVSSDSVQILPTPPQIKLNTRRPSDTKPRRSRANKDSDSIVVVSDFPPPKPPRMHKSPRMIMDAVVIMSPPRRTNSQSLHPSSSLNLMPKRSRSPSVQYTGSSHLAETQSIAPKPKSPFRHKKIFETDSDQSPNDSIVVIQKSRLPPPATAGSLHRPVKRSSPSSQDPPVAMENLTSCKSPSRRSPKKARFDEDDPDAELIPSSQSDEQELALPKMTKKDPEDIKESVNKWRQEAVPEGSPTPDEWAMDVDDDVHMTDVDLVNNPVSTRSSPLQTSEEEVCAGLLSSANNSTVPTTPPSPAPFATRSKTPPRPSIDAGHHILLPVTPVAQDTESKTAQIIAQIKAKALAATASSADESGSRLVFKELSDSSSDGEEEDFLDIWPVKKAHQGKGKSLGSHNEPAIPSSRGSSRSSSLSPCSSLDSGRHRTSGRLHRQTNHQRAVATELQPKPKARKSYQMNPLDFLLKEKRIADERVEGKTSEGQNLNDEEAAWRAVREGARSGSDSSPNGRPENDSGGNDEDIDLGEDQAKMLGLKDSDRMKNILANDRAKLANERVEKVLGVPFWGDKPNTHGFLEDMVAESDFPSLESAHPVHRHLQRCWGDNAKVDLLLTTGLLFRVPASDYIPLVPFFVQSALSPHAIHTGEMAFAILSYVWSGRFPVMDDLLSLLFSALRLMGAERANFENLGWSIPLIPMGHPDLGTRAVLSSRFIRLSATAIRAGALSCKDASRLVLTLLLIALDPSSSEDIKREVMVAVDSVCKSLGGDSNANTTTENDLCEEMIKFASSLTPINQAHVTSFFSGGCGQSSTIARRIAHALLVGKQHVSFTSRPSLPPLIELVDLVSPKPGSGGPFDIQINGDTIDYEDLGYRVEILSVALSGLDDYIAEERQRAGSAADRVSQSPGKFKEKPPTELELVRQAIDVLNGKIVDTRAAHLDRSRTKAALQRLSMRIYYQQKVASKPRGAQKRGIQFYMSK